MLEQAVADLLRTVERKEVFDEEDAKAVGFCPLRFLAEHLMRNRDAAAGAGSAP